MHHSSRPQRAAAPQREYSQLLSPFGHSADRGRKMTPAKFAPRSQSAAVKLPLEGLTQRSPPAARALLAVQALALVESATALHRVPLHLPFAEPLSPRQTSVPDRAACLPLRFGHPQRSLRGRWHRSPPGVDFAWPRLRHTPRCGSAPGQLPGQTVHLAISAQPILQGSWRHLQSADRGRLGRRARRWLRPCP